MTASARPFRFAVSTALAFAMAAGTHAVPPSAHSARAQFVAEAPLYFEAHSPHSFIARGTECAIELQPTGATLTFARRDLNRTENRSWKETTSGSSRTVRLTWLGANAQSTLSGVQRLSGTANYLTGADASQWRTGLPLFGKVQAAEVYPGIDLVYYADASARLEYDFVLQPGARASQIQFRVDGADSVRVSNSGELVIKLGAEKAIQHRPVIFQNTASGRKMVSGGYRLLSRDTVGFEVGAYDETLPLVIDPVLSFSTFVGGAKAEYGWAVAVDAANNVYVAGETLSQNFATTNAFQRKYGGGIGAFGDAFVAKFDATTKQLVYRTYLGGRTDDGALAMDVDAAGRVYVTGFTDSRNFPLVPSSNALTMATLSHSGRTNNAFRIFPINTFVARLDTSGSSLDFSVLLGGSRRDVGLGIDVDNVSGDVFVTGLTESTNFSPVSVGASQPLYGGRGDAFVTRLTSLADPVAVYSTFLGGKGLDQGQAIAVNTDRAFITGFTSSTNFPVTNALVVQNTIWTNGVTFTNLNMQPRRSVALDAFVTALDPSGNRIYSTYLGGTNDDSGMAIATDSAANAYVAGYTFSRVFPTNTAVTPLSPSTATFNSHAFVTKIAPDGSLVYSTQFGSTRRDRATGIAYDAANSRVYVSGSTTFSNFFATNASFVTDFRAASVIRKHPSKTPIDVFLVGLQETGGTAPLTFTNATLFGGSANDFPNSMALGSAGGNVAVWIVGDTVSRNLVVTNSYPPFELQRNLGNNRSSKAKDVFLIEAQLP